MQNIGTLRWTKGVICDYADPFTHSCGLSTCKKYNLSPSTASSSGTRAAYNPPAPLLPEELIINGITYIKKKI